MALTSGTWGDSGCPGKLSMSGDDDDSIFQGMVLNVTLGRVVDNSYLPRVRMSEAHTPHKEKKNFSWHKKIEIRLW